MLLVKLSKVRALLAATGKVAAMVAEPVAKKSAKAAPAKKEPRSAGC